MEHMDLFTILNEVLYHEIVDDNNMNNIQYFKNRMENEDASDELVAEAIGILEELLNFGELENIVSMEKPENKKTRRANLNEFVALCEKLAGVDKNAQQPLSRSTSSC